MPLLESELGPDQPAEGEFLLTREEMAELREEREHEPNARNPERELILDAIDEWRSGARATAAAPVGSSLYESRMRHELRTLYQRLLAIEPGNKAAARELAALEGGHELNEYDDNAKRGEKIGQIVLARLVPDIALAEEGRVELGERHKFRDIEVPKALMWKARATQGDYEKASEFAAQEGYTVFVYPTSERDPLGRAKRDISERGQHPNANHWVWVLSASGEPIEGPYGPHDLEGAKTFARISATEGKHNRAVTRGRDPRAKGFEIIREYKAGTGEHVVKAD